MDMDTSTHLSGLLESPLDELYQLKALSKKILQ